MLKERYRVGVIGLTRSGKTVFLTSLIDHLSKHDPERFPVVNNSGVAYRISHEKGKPDHPATPEFSAEAYRKRLQRNDWPKKTSALSEYRCTIRRDDWAFNPIDLSFTDFAGERMADMSMAGRDYADWSDRMIQFFRETPPYRDAMAPFLDSLQAAERGEFSDDADGEARLVDAYRLGLARSVWAFLPMITPSCFALNRNGDGIKRADYPAPEDLANRWYAGRDEAEQFSPLSKAARDRVGGIADEFEERYTTYRNEIVRPLAALFARCEALVVLMDPTWILSIGSGAQATTQSLLALLLEYVQPGQDFVEGWFDWGVRKVTGGAMSARDAQEVANRMSLNAAHAIKGFLEKFGADLGEINEEELERDLFPNVTRIAFVGTKADKVHSHDRDALKGLLDDLVDPVVKPYRKKRNFQAETFLCSAVRSSESDEEYPVILGRLEKGGSGATDRIKPSPVPSEWPADWKTGEFRYPNIKPIPPASIKDPPEHIGLEKITQFLFAAW